MNARFLVVAFALVLASGCARRLIPGTEIEETDDTMAILNLINQYRLAVEGRDADKIVSLVSSDFKDDRGTPQLDDDVDAQTLGPTLKQQFAKVNNVRLNLEVRNIQVEEDHATAIYFYTLYYELPGLTERQQSASELKKMQLRRVDNQWKIAGGI